MVWASEGEPAGTASVARDPALYPCVVGKDVGYGISFTKMQLLHLQQMSLTTA